MSGSHTAKLHKCLNGRRGSGGLCLQDHVWGGKRHHLGMGTGPEDTPHGGSRDDPVVLATKVEHGQRTRRELLLDVHAMHGANAVRQYRRVNPGDGLNG